MRIESEESLGGQGELEGMGWSEVRTGLTCVQVEDGSCTPDFFLVTCADIILPMRQFFTNSKIIQQFFILFIIYYLISVRISAVCLQKNT